MNWNKLTEDMVVPCNPKRPLTEIATAMFAAADKYSKQGLELLESPLEEYDLLNIKEFFGTDGGVILHQVEYNIGFHFDSAEAEVYVRDLSVEDRVTYRQMCKSQMVFVIARLSNGSIETYLLKPPVYRH